MFTYKVLMFHSITGIPRDSIIVASCDTDAAKFAEMFSPEFVAIRSILLFAGSPAD